MTDFIDIPNSNDLQKLSGHIENFRKSRETANFFFTARDQSNMRLGAILSALVGDSGQAASLSSYASSMEDAADFVQFELEGRAISGWLCGSPFKDGDYVEAAVKKQGSSYELFAVYKPEDRNIALYPHCVRGTRAFLHMALRRTFFVNVFFLTALCLLFLFGGSQSLEQAIEFISSKEATWGSCSPLCSPREVAWQWLGSGFPSPSWQNRFFARSSFSNLPTSIYRNLPNVWLLQTRRQRKGKAATLNIEIPDISLSVP